MRSREEIFGEMQGAAQSLPQFEVALPHLLTGLANAKRQLAEAEAAGADTATLEDWRLTVHLHKCAVAFNQANQQVINRALMRLREEADALES